MNLRDRGCLLFTLISVCVRLIPLHFAWNYTVSLPTISPDRLSMPTSLSSPSSPSCRCSNCVGVIQQWSGVLVHLTPYSYHTMNLRDRGCLLFALISVCVRFTPLHFARNYTVDLPTISPDKLSTLTSLRSSSSPSCRCSNCVGVIQQWSGVLVHLTPYSYHTMNLRDRGCLLFALISVCVRFTPLHFARNYTVDLPTISPDKLSMLTSLSSSSSSSCWCSNCVGVIQPVMTKSWGGHIDTWQPLYEWVMCECFFVCEGIYNEHVRIMGVQFHKSWSNKLHACMVHAWGMHAWVYIHSQLMAL